MPFINGSSITEENWSVTAPLVVQDSILLYAAKYRIVLGYETSIEYIYTHR